MKLAIFSLIFLFLIKMVLLAGYRDLDSMEITG
jgi:hypothetical protein